MILKYLSSPNLYEDKSQIVDIIPSEEDNKYTVVLNDSIFYPKGGGQPSDKGTLSLENTIFLVEEVKIQDNQIHHKGRYATDNYTPFKISDQIILKVDQNKRKEHSAIHSLGHLIDEAMLSLGYYTHISPSKAFHYPEGPSVEYKGYLSNYSLETIKQEVETEVNKMLKEGFETKSFFITKDELNKYCHKNTMNPALLNSDSNAKNIRIVNSMGRKRNNLYGHTCGKY